MDVVYIFKFGQQNSLELKYSLRSLEKNFKHNRVFIIGDRPNWIKNIIHIKVVDRSKDVYYNTGYKLYRTTLINDLSEDFIVMHDDMYLYKTVENIENYYEKNLAQILKNRQLINNHYRSLEKVLKIFPEGLNFDLHFPYKLNKLKLKQLFKKYPLTNTYCVNSLYCNEFKIKGIPAIDFKIRKIEDIERLKKEQPLAFSNPDVLIKNKEFTNFLEQTYPNKSKYEV